VTDAGLNEHDINCVLETPEHDRATALLKPFVGVMVIVDVALVPGATEAVPGAALMEKSCAAPGGALKATACIAQLLVLLVKVAVASTPDALTVVIWCSAVSPFTVCAVVTKLPPGPVKKVSVVPAPIITSLAVEVLIGPLSAFFPTPV
jgi:hypothetical protein